MDLPTATGFGPLSHCLSNELIRVVTELGFENPTPVQAQAIPLLIEGKDVIAQSETGSGKTAAFSLPILQNLKEYIRLRPRSAQALVLCPTRELCAQVAREIRKLGRRQPGLQVLILSGGMPSGPQLGSLERGVHVVVGTPGRVLDHLLRKSLVLTNLKTVVLDEADRMLEMGFQEDMERILRHAPTERQTVLFSATFPKTIEALSRAYQRKPVRITVESKTQTVESIHQLAFQAESDERTKALLWVIEQNRSESVLVFCNFKASVASLASQLSEAGLSVGALHGDLEQCDRDRIMAQFRNRSTRILVATDVAARGIDVENLDMVVNFELPLQPEIYVHRIGRTGRAGKKGLAVSFHSARESMKIRNIEQYAGVELHKKRLPDLKNVQVNSLSERMEARAAMRTLFISGGRKDKVRPGDILGALTGEAGGLRAADVGKIEIHDRFSYVAVASEIAEVALERLRNGRIKGRKFRIEPVK